MFSEELKIKEFSGILLLTVLETNKKQKGRLV